MCGGLSANQLRTWRNIAVTLAIRVSARSKLESEMGWLRQRAPGPCCGYC